MKAYITLLSSDNYYEGVVILKRCLSAVKAKYPLVCMLSHCVDESLKNKLISEGVDCICLENREFVIPSNPNGGAFSHWEYTFDKLQAWGLERYEKLVFVDSDMLVRENLDFLFDLPAFTAVCAGEAFQHSATWRGLNSGLIVIEPQKSVKDELFKLVRTVVVEYQLKGQFVGDQDVINAYIPEWPDQDGKHLDEGYNMFADYLSWYIRNEGYSWMKRNGKTIAIVHFIGKQKPWMKKNLRNWLWFIRECIRNPYYLFAYRQYMSYLK